MERDQQLPNESQHKSGNFIISNSAHPHHASPSPATDDSLHTADDGFILVDVALNIISYNEHAFKCYETYLGKSLAKGVSISQAADQAPSDELEKIYKQALMGENKACRITSRDTNGFEHTYLVKSSGAKDEKGQVTEIFISIRDVTRQTENDLLVNKSLLSAIINNSEDAIISKNLDGIVTSWNKGAEHMFGYTAAEIIGKSITVIIPPEIIQEETYILNKIKSREVIDHYETERLDKSGNRKAISLTVSPILDADGKVVGASKIARNISRQKQDAIEIQQNASRLHGIIASQTNYVIRTDLQGNYTYYNEKFFADFGWMNKEKSLIGMSGMSSIMPYHHEVVTATVTECLAKPNSVKQVELDKPFLDGTIKTTLWDFICLTDQQGNPTEIQCMGIDITQRAKAEQELKVSMQQINSILESIGDAFFAVDKNWLVTYWNHNAASMMEIPEENILGRNIWEFFPEEENPVGYENFKEALESNELRQYESFYPITNRWYETSVYPSMNGLSVYFKDITDRKKSADIILEANERFNLVSLATNDVIWDYNVVSRSVIRSASNMKRVFGYDESFEINSIDFWMSNIHPEDAGIISSQFDSVFNNAAESFMESEYRFKKADGTYAYVYDKGYIVRDVHGKPLRMIGAVQDVSWLKEKELQLQKKSEELAVSNKELEQFAFIASHDLQEPLRMVTSFLSQLKKNYASSLDDRANTYINFAVDGSIRMRKIILDLLEYSRVGRTKQKIENVHFASVIREITVMAQTKIQEVEATIIYDNLPSFRTYRSPMQQLFRNLIMNALKFSTVGVPSKIEITATKHASQWMFAVKDNGIGIEKEYYDKIFIIFQRLHNREEYAGTGIGLSVAKKIVETMGGKIWVESTEGQGSTFYFTTNEMDSG